MEAMTWYRCTEEQRSRVAGKHGSTEARQHGSTAARQHGSREVRKHGGSTYGSTDAHKHEIAEAGKPRSLEAWLYGMKSIRFEKEKMKLG
jgi:hypothetical protein